MHNNKQSTTMHAQPGKVYRSELTPVTFLRRSAEVYPARVAIVHGARRYTYAQLQERVNRLASRLRAVGLRKGERIAFLCPNIPALLEAHFGVPAAGGVLVAINSRLSTQEIGQILAHSGARMLFVDHELLPAVAPLNLDIELVRVDDSGAPDDPYEDFLAAGTPEPMESWLVDEEDIISLNYTSGTTGQPKGVMYTHRGGYLNALGEVIEMGMHNETVYLWTLPMFHCNGWCFPWAVVAVGGTQVCLRRFEPAAVWRVIAEERVSHYCGAPTVHLGLVNDPNARPLERTVTAGVAAAPPSPSLLAQMKALNLRPIHVYGLTETYGPHTVCAEHPHWRELPNDEHARLLSRQGQGYVTAELARVVDIGMRDVPRDGQTIGEVVMRGNNVMAGYYAAPEATATAFRGGWFHSGDLGVWHPDGYIELRDRLKDIIISGGENISTIEVEQAIVSHPAVLECAVVAIPDAKWGERPKAFVTLKPGQSASAADLIAHCRARLAHFKAPDTIEFGELPKTSTGKVQKYALREREWVGREKRVN